MKQKTKETTSSIATPKQPIVVRKARPEELFFRTGNVEHRHCIIERVVVNAQSILQWQYRPLKEPALHAMTAWSTSVLFHELVTETGEQIAYPQILGEDRSIPAAWRKCETALFMEPLYHWTWLAFSDDPGKYDVRLNYEKAASPFFNPLFGEQLDEALRHDVIETLDHPIVQRLQYIFGDIEEGAPDEWVDIS